METTVKRREWHVGERRSSTDKPPLSCIVPSMSPQSECKHQKVIKINANDLDSHQSFVKLNSGAPQTNKQTNKSCVQQLCPFFLSNAKCEDTLKMMQGIQSFSRDLVSPLKTHSSGNCVFGVFNIFLSHFSDDGG